MTVLVVILGLVAAAAEIAGGSLVVLKKKWPAAVQEYLLALSAGFILALAFVELIPESISSIGGEAALFFLGGFSLLHFFEHTIVGHLHFGEETHTDIVSRTASIATFGGLLVHAFFDGFAISAGVHFRFEIGLLVFLAVLLHKIPEGLTIASVMLAASHRRRTAFLASATVGAATVLGVLSVFFLSEFDSSLVGKAFALSAGIAVYVGASDLIPEINRSANRVTPVFVFVGMLLLYVGKLLFGTSAVRP